MLLYIMRNLKTLKQCYITSLLGNKTCCGLKFWVKTALNIGYMCSHSLTAMEIIWFNFSSKPSSCSLMITECLNTGIWCSCQYEKWPNHKSSLTRASSSKIFLVSAWWASKFNKHEICKHLKCSSQAKNKSILSHLPSTSTTTSFTLRRSNSKDLLWKILYTVSIGLSWSWICDADNILTSLL